MSFQPILLSGLFLLSALFPLNAQIQGLWGVDKVAVGEEEMTPVAKWFDLKDSGRCLGGNGGVINARADYDWDVATERNCYSQMTFQVRMNSAPFQ